MNEQEFTATVLELASWAGWRRFHPRPAMYSSGRWATHYQGDAGFPDLVLVHPRKGLIFAELKVGTNKPTEQQKLWLAELDAAGAEAYLWRPDDLEVIRKRLGFPRGRLLGRGKK